MPANKDVKRLIRTRMRKTGESYTAARAQLLKRKASPRVVPVAPPADYARLAGMSDDAVKAKTGCTWERWVSALDRHGAAGLPHREIAQLVRDKYKVGDWWAQMVTVGYERIRGLRAIGQRLDGTYEASRSRTLPVPVRDLFRAFKDTRTRRRWLDVPVTIRTATRDRSVRMGWNDGTVVLASFTPKDKARTVVSIQHMKLADRAASDRLKAFWGERLEALATRLA
jgi:uncharacterized protein YndB with AHSA1/START domain